MEFDDRGPSNGRGRRVRRGRRDRNRSNGCRGERAMRPPNFHSEAPTRAMEWKTDEQSDDGRLHLLAHFEFTNGKNLLEYM